MPTNDSLTEVREHLIAALNADFVGPSCRPPRTARRPIPRAEVPQVTTRELQSVTTPMEELAELEPSDVGPELDNPFDVQIRCSSM